jgi:hypothetical protein
MAGTIFPLLRDDRNLRWSASRRSSVGLFLRPLSSPTGTRHIWNCRVKVSGAAEFARLGAQVSLGVARPRGVNARPSP